MINVIKAIIFDFKRTIFDVEKKCVSEETTQLIGMLKKRGLKLALISRSGQDQRIGEIAMSGVLPFFDFVKVVEEKSKEDFEEIAGKLGFLPSEILVVGDRIKSEIKLAKQAGMKTSWYRSGKFANEFPEGELENPDNIIYNLAEVDNYLNFESKNLRRR